MTKSFSFKKNKNWIGIFLFSATNTLDLKNTNDLFLSKKNIGFTRLKSFTLALYIIKKAANGVINEIIYKIKNVFAVFEIGNNKKIKKTYTILLTELKSE